MHRPIKISGQVSFERSKRASSVTFGWREEKTERKHPFAIAVTVNLHYMKIAKEFLPMRWLHEIQSAKTRFEWPEKNDFDLVLNGSIRINLWSMFSHWVDKIPITTILMATIWAAVESSFNFCTPYRTAPFPLNAWALSFSLFFPPWNVHWFKINESPSLVTESVRSH